MNIFFLGGLIIGLILLYLYKKLKYFLRNQLNPEEESSSLNSSQIWMYELRDRIYNPHTFSYSMTNICLIEIRKNLLFIFQPSKEPDHKLNDHELYSNVTFNQIRIYNLHKAIIGLAPHNLIYSKYWSQKFPIVLKNIRHIRNEDLQTSIISNENNIRKTLVLFIRTRRCKEDWFYRLINASKIKSWKKEIQYQLIHYKPISNLKQIYKTDNVEKEDDKQEYRKSWIKFLERTDRFAALDQLNNTGKILPNQIKKYSSNRDLNTNYTENDFNQYQHKTYPLLFFIVKYLQNLSSNTIENPIFLINIFASRCFLDIFDNEIYIKRIKTFLQKQLQKIKIPFIKYIIITNLNLGDRLPEIKDIFKPWIDEHGLWSHINISYDGKLQLTLNAKLKWIRKSHKKPHRRLFSPIHWFRDRRNNNTKNSSYGREALPKLSKTMIVIKFEVNSLNGILLFNIPPIPSNRIWISFFQMPQMEFSAIPHLGEYRVPFYKIKNKLRQIFHRYLVMPNMIDFVIPTINNYLSDISTDE